MNTNPYYVAIKQLLLAIKHMLSVVLALPGMMLTDKVAEHLNLSESPVTKAKLQILTIAVSICSLVLGISLVCVYGLYKRGPVFASRRHNLWLRSHRCLCGFNSSPVVTDGGTR